MNLRALKAIPGHPEVPSHKSLSDAVEDLSSSVKLRSSEDVRKSVKKSIKELVFRVVHGVSGSDEEAKRWLINFRYRNEGHHVGLWEVALREVVDNSDVDCDLVSLLRLHDTKVLSIAKLVKSERGSVLVSAISRALEEKGCSTLVDTACDHLLELCRKEVSINGNAAMKLTALRSSGIIKDVAVGNSKKRPRPLDSNDDPHSNSTTNAAVNPLYTAQHALQELCWGVRGMGWTACLVALSRLARKLEEWANSTSMHLLQSLVVPHAKCLVRMACRATLGHPSEFLDTAVLSIGIKVVVDALKEELQVAQEPEWLASGLEVLVCVLAKEALKSSTSSCASSGQYTHDRLMSPHAMTGENLLSSLLDLSKEVVTRVMTASSVDTFMPAHFIETGHSTGSKRLIVMVAQSVRLVGFVSRHISFQEVLFVALSHNVPDDDAATLKLIMKEVSGSIHSQRNGKQFGQMASNYIVLAKTRLQDLSLARRAETRIGNNYIGAGGGGEKDGVNSCCNNTSGDVAASGMNGLQLRWHAPWEERKCINGWKSTVPSADRDVDAAAKDLQETGDLNREVTLMSFQNPKCYREFRKALLSPPSGMDMQLIDLRLNLAEALAKNGNITETQFKVYKKACEPYTRKAHKLGSKDGGGGNDDIILIDELLQLEQDIERVKRGNNGNGGHICLSHAIRLLLQDHARTLMDQDVPKCNLEEQSLSEEGPGNVLSMWEDEYQQANKDKATNAVKGGRRLSSWFDSTQTPQDVARLVLDSVHCTFPLLATDPRRFGRDFICAAGQAIAGLPVLRSAVLKISSDLLCSMPDEKLSGEHSLSLGLLLASFTCGTDEAAMAVAEVVNALTIAVLSPSVEHHGVSITRVVSVAEGFIALGQCGKINRRSESNGCNDGVTSLLQMVWWLSMRMDPAAFALLSSNVEAQAFADKAIGDSAVSVTLDFELRMCEVPHKEWLSGGNVRASILRSVCTNNAGVSELLSRAVRSVILCSAANARFSWNNKGKRLEDRMRGRTSLVADSWLPSVAHPFAASVDVLLSAVVDVSWMEIIGDNRGPSVAAAEILKSTWLLHSPATSTAFILTLAERLVPMVRDSTTAMTLWDSIIQHSPVPVMTWPTTAAEAGLMVSLSCGIDIEMLETAASSVALGTTSPRVVLILALQLRWILEFYTRLLEENYSVQNYSRLRRRAQQVARAAIEVMNQEEIKLGAEIEGCCSRIAKLDPKFL